MCLLSLRGGVACRVQLVEQVGKERHSQWMSRSAPAETFARLPPVEERHNLHAKKIEQFIDSAEWQHLPVTRRSLLGAPT